MNKTELLSQFNYFKIAIYIPKKYLNNLMEKINSNMKIVYKNYDYVFSFYEVTGTWRPLEGANPFKGKKNKIEKAKEIKIEFLVKKDDLENVLKTIKENHPYEQPAIDIYPVIPGFDF